MDPEIIPFDDDDLVGADDLSEVQVLGVDPADGSEEIYAAIIDDDDDVILVDVDEDSGYDYYTNIGDVHADVDMYDIPDDSITPEIDNIYDA